MDVRVQRKYWITKMRFCITLSNARWTLFISLVKWRKIHCKLHWAIASVSQNAHWYFQKFLKCSQLKVCCSCEPAPVCPLTGAGVPWGAGRAAGAHCSPHLAAPECPGTQPTAVSAWGKHEGRTGSQKCQSSIPPLPLLMRWWKVSWFWDGFNSLGLNKTEDIRDKLDLEGERWDQARLIEHITVLKWWMMWLRRGNVVKVCEQGLRLPSMSQLHRNIVWVKNWPNPIDLGFFVYSIPIYDKTLGVGEGGKCDKKQNSIPENGDFLPHLLHPCTPDPISSVCPPAEENYGLTVQLSHIPFSILVLICTALVLSLKLFLCWFLLRRLFCQFNWLLTIFLLLPPLGILVLISVQSHHMLESFPADELLPSLP